MPSEPPVDVQRVSVVGAGPMGQQIALQATLRGFDVVLYDVSPKPLERFARFMERPEATLRLEAPFLFEGASSGSRDPAQAFRRITRSTDPRDAADCDLLVESVSEKAAAKRQVFAQFNAVCPSHTVFTTNSSAILPSALAADSGRPGQFAALHFALGDWIVEIMAHPGTTPQTVATIDRFARQIADLAVHCQRESQGYVLNRLLMWVNAAALDLAAEGVATPEDIDRLFMRSFRAKIGPFGALDGIGLDTVYAITVAMRSAGKDPAGRQRLALLKQYLDRGMVGRKEGAGFYRYPGPAFEEPGFAGNAR